MRGQNSMKFDPKSMGRARFQPGLDLPTVNFPVNSEALDHFGGNEAVAGKPVLVSGVFDLFHRGHLELLRTARSLGDSLVVIVNSDDLTSRYKRQPVYSQDDRLAIVKSFREVDAAYIVHSSDARPIIEEHGIRVVVHGDDWEHESYMKQICVDEDYLREHSCELKYVPYYPHISTSDIISRIRDSNGAGPK